MSTKGSRYKYLISDTLKVLGQPLIHAVEFLDAYQTVEVPIQCRGETRVVKIEPFGSVTVDHTTEELKTIIAAEILGHPICPCIQFKRFITARTDESKQIKWHPPPKAGED